MIKWKRGLNLRLTTILNEAGGIDLYVAAEKPELDKIANWEVPMAEEL